MATAGEVESDDEAAATGEHLVAEVEAAQLDTLVETALAVADECRLHFDADDGATVRIVDSANVCMVDATLRADAFDVLETTGLSFGVNLQKFDDVLGYCNGGIVALEYDHEKQRLAVESGDFSADVSLIASEYIREEPDLPEIDATSEITVTGSNLSRMLDAPTLVSDHIAFETDAEAETFTAIGEGDTDETRIAYDAGDCQAWAVSQDDRGLFSADYLVSIQSVVPDVPVDVSYKSEFPIAFDYDWEAGHTRFMVAPRIET